MRQFATLKHPGGALIFLTFALGVGRLAIGFTGSRLA